MAHSKLTKEQLQEFKETFDMFDTDRNGTIDKDELTQMMKKLGQEVDVEEIVNIMTNADHDGDGLINFEEFVEVMADNMAVDENECIRQGFQVFDKDKSGKITAIELKNVLKNFGDLISDSEIDDLVREVDLDGDGEVDYEEFLKVMKRH